MLSVALIALSAAGIALSIYTLHKMSCTDGTCDMVLSHPTSRLFGFPNAYISIVYCAAMLLFGVNGLVHIVSIPLWPALAASALSVAMSGWLAYVLFLRLRRF